MLVAKIFSMDYILTSISSKKDRLFGEVNSSTINIVYSAFCLDMVAREVSRESTTSINYLDDFKLLIGYFHDFSVVSLNCFI